MHWVLIVFFITGVPMTVTVGEYSSEEYCRKASEYVTPIFIRRFDPQGMYKRTKPTFASAICVPVGLDYKG